VADFFGGGRGGCIPPPLEYYQFRASYHEAGHAVIAALHGACIDSVEISKSDGSGCITAHFLLPKVLRKNTTLGIRQKFLSKNAREVILKKIIKARLDIHLAGLVAEEMKFGIPNFNTGRTDLRNFHIDVGNLLQSPATGSQVLDCREFHWQVCKEQLKENWEWVERVAQELFERKFLSHKDIEGLRWVKLADSREGLLGEVIYVDFSNKNRIIHDDIVS